jgi:glycosyltransferase involved in cell wall biosynthesis
LSEGKGMDIIMKINIICPETWILNKIAYQLHIKINNSVMNNQDIDKFDINYYINYNLFEKKSKAFDIGWFTHIDEDNEELKNKFFWAASMVDYCICHSRRYEKILKQKGFRNKVITITPGIDEIYKPKLVLGFIGRSYSNHTNPKYKTDRKGLDLLEKIQKNDFIELKMTLGEVPDSKMVDFYRQLDYVIITSKFEGGPMCLIEGLSCGIPIIAPNNVGMVSEFDKGIYCYDRENINSLFKLLDKLYFKKIQLKRQVEKFTWDNFAIKHKQLFEKLYRMKYKFNNNYNENTIQEELW